MTRLSCFFLLASTVGCATLKNQPRNLDAELAAMDERGGKRATDHEAGHALWALLHPDVLFLVSATVGDNATGATTTLSYAHRGDQYDKIIAYLAVNFAGEAADRILNGQQPLKDGQDRAQAERRADELLDPDASRSWALGKAERLAYNELRKHKDELERLSQALRARKYLGILEARQIWKGATP